MLDPESVEPSELRVGVGVAQRHDERALGVLGGLGAPRRPSAWSTAGAAASAAAAASASSTAATSSGPTSSTCHGRAPRPASWSATPAARASGSRVRGGAHSTRRRESGVSRFSAGMPTRSDSAVTAARARLSRLAATGSFSAQARATGGPSVRGERVGRSCSGISATRVSAATHRLA